MIAGGEVQVGIGDGGALVGLPRRQGTEGGSLD